MRGSVNNPILTLKNNRNKKILYNLNRLFFILFPFNILFIKIISVPQVTFWKEFVILTNLFVVLFSSKDFFLKKYIFIVFITLLIDLFLNRFSFDHVFWLSTGLPVFNYFKQVNRKHFDIDLCLIIILMCLGAFWIFFFESRGNYSYFFVAEKEEFTLLRGDTLRMRYCFVSPMALSQFSWFTLVCVTTNQRYNKIFKIIATLLIGYVLIVANTRAGYLLLGVSILMFVYSYFCKANKWIVFCFILLGCIIIIDQLLVNSVAESETSLSDALRFVRIQNGITSIKVNWLFGMGGEFFSPRSQYFTNISNFENSWLSLIYSFGTLGILLIFIIVNRLGGNISSNNYNFLCLSIAWLLYSILFPILQEATSIYITWCIIAFSCHFKKFEYFSLKSTRGKTRFNMYYNLKY
ncbi:O-antigen ligase family protein [Flavobacterium sp. HJJ]|uniref:O-antigen ligase family protein n=1 Tax=Flavobacterium sp. HJJ TaxID=2783792 RepID=UPI00188C2E96|nr:O-antigen ligase family protein [Flavobacterium sp. HJJ]MBF4470430.1 O-antigen ligase family protein [Flavobacterium sp. HJJ]